MDVATMTDSEGDEMTQIRVTKAQRAELHDMKRPEESYSDVVARLLDGRGNGQNSN